MKQNKQTPFRTSESSMLNHLILNAVIETCASQINVFSKKKKKIPHAKRWVRIAERCSL